MSPLSHLAIQPAELGLLSLATVAILFATQSLKEIGVPSPGVTQGALVFAGYQLSRGDVLSFGGITMAIVLGGFFGASFVYSASRYWGGRLVARYGRYLHLTEESLEKVRSRLQSKVFVPVFLGRSVPGMMAPTSIASGTMRLPLSRFMGGVALSLAFWAAIFIAAGALFSGLVHKVSLGIDVNRVFMFLPVFAAVVLMLGLAYFFSRHKISKRRRREAAEGKHDR